MAIGALVTKRILIIHGNPKPEGLSDLLTETYRQSAAQAGHDISVLDLRKLRFELNLDTGYSADKPLEPDLIAAQQQIRAAEHLVWIFPVWWGTFPALLKGFLDRTFLPGFAFRYKKDTPWWDKLLAGKSARVIVTMDTPKLFFRWLYGRPVYHAMKHTILGFSGVKPVRFTFFDKARYIDEKRLSKWIRETEKIAAKAI
jgi:NAD(P)H dehydrogenase (quinone)